jgi:hypothetical protein
MPDHQSVISALTNAYRHIKVWGFLTVSMLPETKKAMRSCETLVAKNFIIENADQLGYEVITFSDMGQWGIGNQVDRYFTVLRKFKHIQKDNNFTELQLPNTINHLEPCPMPTKKPDDMSDIKYNQIMTAQRVLEFIAAKYEEEHAPISINFGSALHEIREGKLCFVPRITDKDIDITVLEAHFLLIFKLEKELKERFCWTITQGDEMKQRMVATIRPLDDSRKSGLPNKNTFQIDFYCFRCDAESNTVWFPWDRITTKSMLSCRSRSTHLFPSSQFSIYMPADPACLLENIYGPDFRTPMDTKFYQPNAVDKPMCSSRSRCIYKVGTFKAVDALLWM